MSTWALIKAALLIVFGIPFFILLFFWAQISITGVAVLVGGILLGIAGILKENSAG